MPVADVVAVGGTAIRGARRRWRRRRFLRLSRSCILKKMLAALEHGRITHDGSRHVLRVSHKNTLCILTTVVRLPSDPFSFPSFRLSSRAARKMKCDAALVVKKSRVGGERGREGVGEGG